MKLQKQQNQISFPTLFAIGTFIIGTVLFLSYMAFPNDSLLVIGFFYVAAAIILNLIILIHLSYQLIVVPHKRTENIIRILILTSNIPIAWFYFSLVMNVY